MIGTLDEENTDDGIFCLSKSTELRTREINPRFLDEQIEQIRLREVKEGNLYDCQLKYNAARTDVNGKARCEGHLMGVGGMGLAAVCETCTCYYEGK